MNFFSRHKNTVVLATVLLAQFLLLAMQVKRQTAEGPVRLIRLLTVSAFAPFERLLIYSGENLRGIWSNYIDLRNVRSENARLKAEAERMRLERAREQEDARQARRIQALLGFKEQWIDTTVAAQVIGTSGTESSRVLYLDKGTKDGIRADMPVITPDGVVGKVLTVYGETAQVLVINDPTSGVGATLVNSRLQGIVKGTPTGDVQLNYIMSDEAVQPGEALVTSGGDRVFPKGLPIGTAVRVSPGRNLFLDIKVKPAVDLDRLEEVLVITEQKSRAPDTAGLGPIRAADILAEHLPGVPQTMPGDASQQPSQSAPGQTAPAAGATPQAAPQKPLTAKPQTVAAAAGASAAKPPLAKPARISAGAPTAVQKPPAPKPTTPKPVTAPKSATPKPVSPNASGPKPKTTAAVQSAGANAAKPPVAKAAKTSASASTAVQKPAVPKPVTKPGSPTIVQKPPSPKSATPKPASASGVKPKPASAGGTRQP
jgi:rod shape-determining protein MreC